MSAKKNKKEIHFKNKEIQNEKTFTDYQKFIDNFNARLLVKQQ